MTEFLSMGGHGVFIWTSYGIAALSLGGLFIWTRKDAKRLRREVNALRPKRTPRES